MNTFVQSENNQYYEEDISKNHVNDMLCIHIRKFII